MAGKHYGTNVVFDDTTPSWCGFQPKLNWAFAGGWKGLANPHTVGTPEYTAWQNGLAVTGGITPTGQVTGRRWETV